MSRLTQRRPSIKRDPRADAIRGVGVDEINDETGVGEMGGRKVGDGGREDDAGCGVLGLQRWGWMPVWMLDLLFAFSPEIFVHPGHTHYIFPLSSFLSHSAVLPAHKLELHGFCIATSSVFCENEPRLPAFSSQCIFSVSCRFRYHHSFALARDAKRLAELCGVRQAKEVCTAPQLRLRNKRPWASDPKLMRESDNSKKIYD